MVDLDKPQFSLGQIAKALGAPYSTIRGWSHLGYFGLQATDQKRKAEGLAHSVSMRTALWIGAMVELTKYRIPAERAAKIARAFVLIGEVDQKTEETLRSPGELYPGDGVYTGLVAYADDDKGTIIRFDSKTPLVPIFFNPHTGRETSALVVWLNFVDRLIRTKLPGAN